MRLRTVLVGLILFSLAATAHAQYYGQPPPPRPGPYYAAQPQGIVREGLVFGGSIGAGAFGISDCHDCETLGALALQLEIGGMITPNLALVVDWTGHLHPFTDGGVLSSNLLDGSLRVFLGRIFWLQGGIGFGYLEATDEAGYSLGSAGGLGLLVAGGVEVLQTYNFALDIELRLSGERIYTDPAVSISNVALLIGFHWY
jgi:hypothetical protein